MSRYYKKNAYSPVNRTQHIGAQRAERERSRGTPIGAWRNINKIGRKRGEPFTGRALPVCKPPPHEPDIKVRYYKRANQYWLCCEVCGQFGWEAVRHKALTEDEKANAVEVDLRIKK